MERELKVYDSDSDFNDDEENTTPDSARGGGSGYGDITR